MPELPEVETVARDLRRLVVGATITGATGDWPRAIRSHPTVDAFAAAVAGWAITAVGRRGKLLVVELSGGAAITIHLKMTGQLFVVPAGAPADAHVHLALALDDGRELRFRDIRKFGRVGAWPRDPVTGQLLEGEGGAELFAGHGPEPLDDAFTVRAFRARLRARRGRLKPLLLDQGFVAGIGNIYADEALWRARLHPLRSAATLRPAGERRLHREIRAVLAEAVERRGSSIDDYTAPDGDGTMQERLLVYQRAGEPCARCGRPIRRIVVGARATHFCSWCQRLPAADRAGAAAILRAARAPRARGRRWVELAGEGALGRTVAGAGSAVPAGHAAGGAARAGHPVDQAARAEAHARAERRRRAAATRRALARAGAGAGAPPAAADPDLSGAAATSAAEGTDRGLSDRPDPGAA